jgi:hypothetical protein
MKRLRGYKLLDLKSQPGSALVIQMELPGIAKTKR